MKQKTKKHQVFTLCSFKVIEYQSYSDHVMRRSKLNCLCLLEYTHRYVDLRFKGLFKFPLHSFHQIQL